MPAASILPVAIHDKKLYFLFGKENPMEDSAKGFSDFGGKIDAGENAFDTAAREGSEELTGFLGSSDALKSRLHASGFYPIVYEFPDDPENTYTVHVLPMKYEPHLVEYYNNNHSFLWEKMDKKYLNKTKLFEKIKIEWFCETEIATRRGEYRSFYQAIVDKIMEHKDKIRGFVRSCPEYKSARTYCKFCKKRHTPRHYHGRPHQERHTRRGGR